MLAGLDFTGNSAAFVEEYEGDIQSLVAMLDNRQTPSESKAQNNKKQFLKKKLCDMEVSWSKRQAQRALAEGGGASVYS